jgi:hypothetical protein
MESQIASMTIISSKSRSNSSSLPIISHCVSNSRTSNMTLYYPMLLIKKICGGLMFAKTCYAGKIQRMVVLHLLTGHLEVLVVLGNHDS